MLLKSKAQQPKIVSQTPSPDKRLVIWITEVTKREKASPASSDSFYRLEIVKKASGERVVVLEKDRTYMSHNYQLIEVKWLSPNKFRCGWLVVEHGENESQTFTVQQNPLRVRQVDAQSHVH